MNLFPPTTYSLHKAHCIHTALFCSLSQCHAISSRWFPRVFKNFKIQTSLDPTEVLKEVKHHCQMIRVITTQLLLDKGVQECVFIQRSPQKAAMKSIHCPREKTCFCVEFYKQPKITIIVQKTLPLVSLEFWVKMEIWGCRRNSTEEDLFSTCKLTFLLLW